MIEVAHLSPTLQALFPPGVVVAETRTPGDATLLFAAEANCLGRAVPKRIQEFAAGRLCARRALREFGIIDFPIVVAQDRQPVWPASVVGSITHTTGLCAAVIADKHTTAGVGIDCEVVDSVNPDIWPTVCGAAELRWIGSLPAHRQRAAVAFIFSAKEAFYKCQYPSTGEWLDFHDIQVCPSQWGEPFATFHVEPLRELRFAPAALQSMVGNYLFHESFITAGVTTPQLPPGQ